MNSKESKPSWHTKLEQLEEDILALEIENHDLQQKIKCYEFEHYKLQEIQRLAKAGTWELNHLSYKLTISSQLSLLLYRKKNPPQHTSWQEFLDTFQVSGDRDIKQELIEKVMQKGEGLDFEHYIKLTDGRTIYVHHHCKTFYNAIGQPLITVGLIHDYTLEHNQSIELKIRCSTDPLTLLYNRRGLNDILKKQYEVFQRYNNISSYIMLDIDLFKNINDAFGHQTGDEVLCTIASFIKQNIRSVDCAGRWGGEEFLIICPNTSQENATLLAEKLRRGFVGLENSANHVVTASFGVAEIAPDESTDALLKRVDDALYKAKENGRNQVQVARSLASS